MERRNLDVDKDAIPELFVTWNKGGTKDDRESTLHEDETIGNCNLGLSEVRNLDQKLEILLVNLKDGPSEVSYKNISAPSVNSTVETSAQDSSASSRILLDSQNPTSFYCACGWCENDYEESNDTLRVNEAINGEAQNNPNVQRSSWIGKFSSIQPRSLVAFGVILLITVVAITATSLHFTSNLPIQLETLNTTKTYCSWNSVENLDWYVSRESWEASEPNNSLEMSSHERAYVVVGHTVTASCTNFKRCSQLMRALQRNAMNAGFKDIPYHFVIAGDGRAYEGRTWQAAPDWAYRCDNNCLFVSFTGDYRNCCSAPNHIPSEEQIQAFDYVLDTSRRLNRLKEDFFIVPQCKVASSQSPGINLYNAIKNCNQFDSTADNFTGFCNFNCAGEC